MENTSIRLPIFRWSYFLGFALIITALFNFTSCKNEGNKDDSRPEYIISDSLVKRLKIDSVKLGKLINTFSLTGQIDFNQDKVINIFPMISGTIQDVKVVLGDYVEKGQVLGIIKSPEMAQYSSDLLDAQTNLSLAKATMEKTADMYKSGLASRTDSITAAVALQQAKAELTRAQRVLSINGDNTQGEYVVKAPISGFIVQKFVNNNMAIRSDNGSALFTISDLKDVWVMANVYESNIGNIHVGDNVDVTTLSHPDHIFKGKVDKMMQMLDPASKAMKVRVVIENTDYALKPQMFASVTVTNTQNAEAIIVPSSALIFDVSQYFVLVYKGNGRAQITRVQKAGTYGKTTYLVTGVKVGERVISSDVLQIYSELNN